jgi:hypothetical protein
MRLFHCLYPLLQPNGPFTAGPRRILHLILRVIGSRQAHRSAYTGVPAGRAGPGLQFQQKGVPGPHCREMIPKFLAGSSCGGGGVCSRWGGGRWGGVGSSGLLYRLFVRRWRDNYRKKLKSSSLITSPQLQRPVSSSGLSVVYSTFTIPCMVPIIAA